MFWKTALTTFILVFLAELGDKTQLATMLLATQNKSILSIFVGASAALVLSAFLGIIAGSVFLRFIPPNLLKICSGTAFVFIGILLILGKS